MKILLKDKKTKPPFLFYVKENRSEFDYYAFNDFEMAMEKARVLSISKFPVSIILEPYQDENGEWKMQRTFRYVEGRCHEDDKLLLHVKFYTDAGNCLNDVKLT